MPAAIAGVTLRVWCILQKLECAKCSAIAALSVLSSDTLFVSSDHYGRGTAKWQFF